MLFGCIGFDPRRYLQSIEGSQFGIEVFGRWRTGYAPPVVDLGGVGFPCVRPDQGCTGEIEDVTRSLRGSRFDRGAIGMGTSNLYALLNIEWTSTRT